MAGPRARRGLLAGLLLTTLGCAAPAQIRYERGLERTPAAARHARHDERLAQVMRGLERLATERLSRAMDVPEAEAGRRAEVAEVARAMAASARDIAERAPALGLEAADEEAFRRLAGTLGRQASELADAAERLPLAALAARSSALQATCDRCHARFRIPETRP